MVISVVTSRATLSTDFTMISPCLFLYYLEPRGISKSPTFCFLDHSFVVVEYRAQSFTFGGSGGIFSQQSFG